jgi:LmbE family N-acetylglucosaminyl deacetylase
MITPKKLLCIFAHPDDEAFGPGGTLAKFSSEGVEIYIACVTCGDAIEKYAKGNDVKTLGEVRREELKNSAKILGIKEIFFLDFADGTLSNNNYHEVTGKLTEILEELKPDTIMTFARNGVSGHLDHVAVSMESSFLFERLPFIKHIMYFCEKKEAKEKMGSNYFVYFPDGFGSDEVDLVVDVHDFLDTKKKAMEAHASQASDVKMFIDLFEEFMGEEYFQVVSKD